jgi:large subunit ribosomal protein L3
MGHLQKIKYSTIKIFKFRIINQDEFEVGQILKVDSLSAGQLVNICGKSIGKGFSGLKRHNFTRGPMTHGSKKS